jgi:hypothetical protein
MTKSEIDIVKTLQQLEAQLQLMRQECADYSIDPEHDARELAKLRSECWTLSGAIERSPQ